MDHPSFVLIGAGNVGFHLGLTLHRNGYAVHQVFSRNLEKVSFLAEKINAEYTNLLSKVRPGASVYILAVTDDAISAVAAELSEQLGEDPLIVHTSGTTPGKVLRKWFKNYGVFYPLQSFNIDRSIDFSVIPICIDASDEFHQQLLMTVANSLSSKVFKITDEQRATLHVAAVFVNNFTNQLYQIGEEILTDRQIPFDLLYPLIEETANRIKRHHPGEVQTGPATRGDLHTIKNHLNLLRRFPKYSQLYREFSLLINPDLKF